jgi:D-alanine--poly(phosphoribitol) ligase subunit 2
MATELNPAGDESAKRVEGLMKDVLAITPDSIDQDLLESGLLDSMALIELLYAIEQEFTVELPLEDLDVELLRSVRGIASYVNQLRG